MTEHPIYRPELQADIERLVAVARAELKRLGVDTTGKVPRQLLDMLEEEGRLGRRRKGEAKGR